jgi:hypothetical protein
MPDLSWSSLQVVAADGLVGERGVALRSPVLRSAEGRFLVPSSLVDETVVPRQTLRQEEVRELIDGGGWIPVRAMPARRNHVLVVRGAPFAAATRTVSLAEDLAWEDHHGRIDIAYVDRAAATAWRARCAERFTRTAERRIGEHLVHGLPTVLAGALSLLELAMFVTNLGTPERRRLFVLLGLAHMERSPATWPVLAETAIAESPGLTRVQLDEAIDDARRDLANRAERSSHKTWATAFGRHDLPALVG